MTFADGSDQQRANPLARGPLVDRTDVQKAVLYLYEPLLVHQSEHGARVRLGSFGAAFAPRVAELEGFARPLYGIVPLTAGGGEFPHWGRVVSGLTAGTDPASPEYWGPVSASPDQRMVEQAAIGLALAFCPEQVWEPLDASARAHLVAWLGGIFEFEPVPNNWQFFRVLVALGLQRVGVAFDEAALQSSLDTLESYRVGTHWYVDGGLGNVDYYVPFAFHTYGLMYAAANRLGLGDDVQAERYRQRAALFANDFLHWFAPDGAGIPFGRSLTYRFAMSSFWGALAWADVPALPWGTVKGLAMRNLRWWATQPISDRDGVLSVGYAYDNRRLAEGYNSACSPYWCMKAFTGLAAPAGHPFWTSAEEKLPPLTAPVEQPAPGFILHRDDVQAVALVAHQGPPFSMFEQYAAKYRKFAYSTVFGFSGDLEPMFSSRTTDSMLALTDDSGVRRVRLGVEAAGLEDGMAWSTWHPWPDVRVDTVLWGGAPWHGRLHRIRSARQLATEETGFALSYDPDDYGRVRAEARLGATTAWGHSSIVDVHGAREQTVRALPGNANVMYPHTVVPMLTARLEAGDHRLGCLVHASPNAAAPKVAPAVPDAAVQLLDRISERAIPVVAS
ncbi:MAG: DUF2264 domain-containing protein [Ilumatobacteraceae bacterium]